MPLSSRDAPGTGPGTPFAKIPSVEHRRVLGSVLDSPDDCVFVADEDGAIKGYVYAALEPLSWKELRGPAGFIHDVAVTEEARRLGVGKKLMQVAMEWLRERRAPRVILWTAASNENAQALFRRLGFRDTMIEMTLELER